MTPRSSAQCVGLPIWGLDFLEDIFKHHSAELIAGLEVAAAAESALRTGRPDHQRVSDARRALCLVSDLPLRRRFDGILSDAISSECWPRPLSRALHAYGQSLHNDGHFLAAIDVFSAVSDSKFADIEDKKLSVQGRAAAARSANRLAMAEMCYHQMDELGAATGDTAMMLRAEAGMARLTVQGGALVVGAKELERIAEAARRAGHAEIAANIEIDIGAIHGVMGRPHKVIEGAIAAEPHLSNAADRDRLLLNTLQATIDDGRAELVPEHLRWLAEHAQELDIRRDAQSMRYAIEGNVRPPTAEERDSLSVLCAALRLAVG